MLRKAFCSSNTKNSKSAVKVTPLYFFIVLFWVPLIAGTFSILLFAFDDEDDDKWVTFTKCWYNDRCYSKYFSWTNSFDPLSYPVKLILWLPQLYGWRNWTSESSSIVEPTSHSWDWNLESSSRAHALMCPSKVKHGAWYWVSPQQMFTEWMEGALDLETTSSGPNSISDFHCSHGQICASFPIKWGVWMLIPVVITRASIQDSNLFWSFT